MNELKCNFALVLTGKDGRRLARVAEACVKVDSDFTPIIQELHITINHIIWCELGEMMV